MWTSYEIKQVQAMYEKLEEETLEDILPSDLIEVIKEDYGNAYMNIRYSCTFCTFLTFCLEIIILNPNTKEDLKRYDL